MLGCKAELKAFHERPGFLGRKGFVESRRRMGVEIIQDHNDLLLEFIHSVESPQETKFSFVTEH